MSYDLPLGFQLSGVHCGLKQSTNREDLALFVSDHDAAAAGVYTKNLVCAAPVRLDRKRTPGANLRAVVLNSGYANACTGDQGEKDAEAMARLAAEALQVELEQVLVLSTGIIGEFLPMEKIQSGIADVAGKLGRDLPAIEAAARAMLTTDLVTKIAFREIKIEGKPCRIFGMAKGSGMIGPNMATMLAVILTDAQLSPQVAQEILGVVVDDSLNCVSVDGHTSTNDTVLLLASGASRVDADNSPQFIEALREVGIDLARAIADDGEGATHLITIEVRGCLTREDAALIAKTVASSPLVKTAIAGADPNWGRIVSAAGYSNVWFDPNQVDLSVNGISLFRQGEPVAFDAEEASCSIRGERETKIVLTFGEGNALARHWTSDLTDQYVRINADYHT